ncbi:serine hydrolase domain-containing protein [Streptomyces sp. NPDC046557]|uniref:serine hydrolase domain-containing protein n=1 Tax=Streptomyces sp. NPDC046557 TaxID=3155372 RepID=UPI0033D368BA
MTKRWRGAAVGAAAVGLVVVPLGVSAGYAWDTAASPASPASPASVTRTTAQPSPSASPASDEFARLTPAVMRQLDEAVQKVMKEAKVPGVIVSLSAPGKGTYERAFGVADKATGAPMGPNLNMRIGSETKTFTVTALLKLVDEGKVGLDDPIDKYVSGVPNGHRITLRQLAEMRSGLFNYSADPGFYKALTGNPRRVFTPQELLAYSFKHPVMFAPGAQFFYCNTNLILLGLVIEKVSGDKLSDYVRHNVIEPAGLHHTLFPTGAEFPNPHAQGYTNQTASGKTQDAADWNPSWGWAAGAMISDRDDLRTWAKVLATGTLLTPQTQAQRLKVLNAENIPDSGYGLGIFNVEGWIGHNGSLPGYESLTIYLPGPQATLVVLLNTDITYQGSEPSTLFGQAITKTVTPEHVFDLPAQPVTGH